VSKGIRREGAIEGAEMTWKTCGMCWEKQNRCIDCPVENDGQYIVDDIGGNAYRVGCTVYGCTVCMLIAEGRIPPDLKSNTQRS